MLILRNLLFLTLFIQSGFSLSQMTPTYNDIWIPMRDGEFLQADIYIPSTITEGEVILIQTPYNKNNFSNGLPLGILQDLDNQPFIWVIVDWRGFYGSNGADVSSVNRGEDGYDVCEWISNQAWHKDRIGTWGPSALGGVQYSTAREQHPNHTCAVPLVAHPQQAYESYFTGGVLEEAHLQTLDALGYGLSPIIMANVYYSNVWAIAESNSWYPDEIAIPTLQIGGWYDHNINKMVEWYEATRNQAAIGVRDEQWLLVGPWVHGGSGAAYVGSSVQGELSYPNAAYKSDSMAWDFFNYYLLDSLNNWQNTDMITYYETGKNTWNTTNATNIAITNSDDIYLSSNEGLVSTIGSGSSGFVSDPNNPSPTIGGANLHPTLEQGPYDQSSLDSRNDIITFSTIDLPSDVQISGNVKLTLYVQADQADCDISVRLVDLYTDGRNMLITDGIKRMRFRNGYTQADEVFMTSGQVYPVEIELPFTNYTWLSGHQIKIYLGGNNAIRWNVNEQNGGPMYSNGTPNIANITIHHNSTYPSKITLPGNNSFLEVIENAEDAIQIYPNPANEKIQISSDQNVMRIEIKDASGRTVMSETDKKDELNISNLKSGVYFLNLYTDNGINTAKFVKN